MPRSKTPLLDRSASDLFRSARSWPDVVRGLADVRIAADERIHLVVVGCLRSLHEVLLKRRRERPDPIARGTDFVAYGYSRRRGARRLSGELLVAQPTGEPVYVVLSVCSADWFRHALSPLLDSLYPHASRGFLTQRELGGLLRALQAAASPDALRIAEFSARRRLVTSARKRYESVRDWTDTDIDSAFHEAAERNVWFRSVKFDVVSRGSQETRWTGLRGLVTKYAHVAVDSRFELIEPIVVSRLLQTTVERVRLFSNRDRMHTPQNSPRPLEISYDRDLLVTPDDLKRLLDGLRRFPKGTCTVLHANPYLHASMVDEVDFSAADVWVLSQNRVLLVPQLAASNAALKRLVNHIFESFGEGKVGEAAEA